MSYTGIAPMFESLYRNRRGLPKLSTIDAEPPAVGLSTPIKPVGFGPGGTFAMPPAPEIPPQLRAAQALPQLSGGAEPDGSGAFRAQASYAPYLQGAAPMPGPDRWQGGFKGRLLAALAGFGLGGPAGAIAGAIDPQIASRLYYDQIQRPRYLEQEALRQKQNEQALDAARIGGANTGYDPISGLPTLAREGLEQRAQAADLRAQGYADKLRLQEQRNEDLNRQFYTGLAQKRDLAEQGFQIKRDANRSTLEGKAANLVMRAYLAGGGSMTPEARASLKGFGLPSDFVDSLPDTHDPNYISTAVDQDGNVTAMSIGRTSGQVKSTTQVAGAGKPSAAGQPKPYSEKDAYDDAVKEYDKQIAQLDSRAKRRLRLHPEEGPFGGKTRDEWIKERQGQLLKEFGSGARRSRSAGAPAAGGDPMGLFK